MSTTPTPPIPGAPAPSVPDTILTLVDSLLQAAGPLVPYEQLADMLLRIVQKGVAAYESHTGQPIDPTLIKPIANV